LFCSGPAELISAGGVFSFLIQRSKSTMKRFEILFTGQVRGVGFRYTTKQLAGSFDVSGTVQNLTNGQVKLIVEGELAEVDRFVAAICETTHGHVAKTEQSVSKANGNLIGFEIIR